jgi:hypothetical protein
MSSILTGKETQRETYLALAIGSACAELLEALEELAPNGFYRDRDGVALMAIIRARSILESATTKEEA